MERFLPIFGVLILGLTLYVNYLAGTGYLNNTTTGEVSALFPTLFTPAGITFAIWGVIYLLNVLFVLLQVYKMIRQPNRLDIPLNGIFILICLTNTVWIFTWHLMRIGWALLLIIVILTLLISAYRRTRKIEYGSYDYFFEHINFSVYLGWISVATVANTAIYLTKLGVPAAGTLATGLTIATITVVLALSIWMILREGNIFFGLVILWSCYGIVEARVTDDILAGAKPTAIAALVAMIVIFLSLAFRFFRMRKSYGQ